ncbi:MAG: hypothetical protein KGP28_02625 [Bdellovibrionales bacterium]|nr:hypothetical protein [Bdellovibrionales bacterium]
MIRFLMSLFFFFSFPILLIALVLGSFWFLVAGLASGIFGILYFWLNSYSEFLLRIRPYRLHEEIQTRLRALWREDGPERMGVEFLGFRTTASEFKVWVHSPGKVGIFLSQGLLESATDQEIRSAFRGVLEMRLREVRKRNRMFSVRLRLDRWKGQEEEFRYWFLSFWLYPLERLLKIAKI